MTILSSLRIKNDEKTPPYGGVLSLTIMCLCQHLSPILIAPQQQSNAAMIIRQQGLIRKLNDLWLPLQQQQRNKIISIIQVQSQPQPLPLLLLNKPLNISYLPPCKKYIFFINKRPFLLGTILLRKICLHFTVW